VLLLVAAGVFLLLEPWHGPVVLALSEQHGVDAGDLPVLVLMALAVAGLRARARDRRRWAGGRVAIALAIVLGAVLLAGVLDPRVGSQLVPAGGGTFDGNTLQAGGVRGEQVGRWSYLAVTYDGAAVRLYVDGVEVSSRSASGPILRTRDPLWIGGNRPYGEYFRGVIDEVRVYGRALGPAEARAAMSTPIGGRGTRAPGLVAAYAFDAGRGRSADDASGHGNAGAIQGARWTSSGRFGRGMRFDGAGEVVRVPASASLDLGRAMTLTAWIKPSEQQSGWRTVVARQTDAYTLMAGGGRENAGRLEAIDRLRFVIVILLLAWMGVVLARGRVPWASGRSRWYWPLALFVAGSLVDVAFAPSDTLIGPALVALWWGATSSHRDERVIMYVLSGAFAALTIVATTDQASLPLPFDDGGVVRSATLGLLLATVGLLSLRHGRRGRPAGPDPLN
jgi:concanavalin A-like lectin/glucanase superfamily protein